MKPTLTSLERWNAPTSTYFKPIQQIGIWIAALSAALAALTHTLNASEVPVPALVDQLTLLFGLLGSIMATLSKLTVDFDKINWQKIHEQREQKLRESLGYFR